MKKDSQERNVQLNNVPPAEEQFTLEEIMREFGGWTKPEEMAVFEPVEEPAPSILLSAEPAQPEKEPAEPSAELPKPADSGVMRIAASEKPEKPAFKLVDLSGDTVRFSPIKEEDLQPEPPAPKSQPVEMPEEPEKPAPDREQEREERKAQKRDAKRLRRLSAQRKKALRAERRAQRRDEPEVVYPSPQDACAAYAKGGTLRMRLLLSALLFLASAGLLLLSQYPVGSLNLTGHRRMFSVVMLALLLLQSLLSADVFIRGIYEILKLRFDLMSLLALTVVITVADAFFAIPAGRMPFCTAISLSLLIALRSVALEKKAKWRTLKTVLSMDNPVAAVKEEKAWHELDCIFRQEGSLEDFTAMLETPDAAKKVMRIYAPVAAVLTLLLAAYASYEGGSDFLWSWAGLLTAALPAGGFLACCRPFGLLANRLHQAGAAICGWRGAKILSGEGGIVITDNDLFPADKISMNGMKMYADLPVKQVVGYATAVVEAAGSGLLPLFEEVLKNENARRYSVDSFRQYEGGGLGAEIRGDVVLLGSLAFMRLMGVQVPEGTRVQSAVYISVNKELVGVFALTYAPSGGTRTGLQNVLHSPGLAPILATRDFMITPGLVKKRYKVPADRLEFPVVAERVRLSDPHAGEKGRQGALMARDSFAGFAAAVTGGRQLRRTVHSAVLVSLLSGLLGMALLFLLTYLGAENAASPTNLLLYQLLWQIPTLLITGLVGKS